MLNMMLKGFAFSTIQVFDAALCENTCLRMKTHLSSRMYIVYYNKIDLCNKYNDIRKCISLKAWLIANSIKILNYQIYSIMDHPD